MSASGIYHRYSDYLETNVQVGVAADRVVSVSFVDEPADESVEDSADVLDDIFAYLDGEDVDLSAHQTALTVTGIERRALEGTRRVPRGTTVTYDDFAASVGADDVEDVREALDTNPVPVLLPSHRVVAESGLGGFPGPARVKRRLLELEGGL